MRSRPGSQPRADGSCDIDGLTLVTDVNAQFALKIDEETYTTVGGYVLGRLGGARAWAMRSTSMAARCGSRRSTASESRRCGCRSRAQREPVEESEANEER